MSSVDPGLEHFAALVGESDRGATLPAFFDATAEVFVARAPGRLDVMGGIADYSGSLVLPLPIAEAAYVGAQVAHDGLIRIASWDPGGRRPPRRVEIPAAEIAGRDYATARERLARTPQDRWAAYVAGVLVVLERERGFDIRAGMRLLLSSSVPLGKGVSSSAAVEVASMGAVLAALGTTLAARDTALLCQKAENLVAGAPCGIMDQMTVAAGQQGRLLELLCQPAKVQGHIAVPDGAAFFGIDSGVRHAVTGSDYGQVRVGAFMGYRILAERAGCAVRIEGERAVVDDPRWGGYLANVAPAEFLERHEFALPEWLPGREFLERYGATTDTVTRVDPEQRYPVRAATVHPIFESFRVRCFAELLRRPADERVLELLGELMYQSHASYAACGLGSEGTDALVRLVREDGPAVGLYGAKITGGGSGGTVAVLARAGADTAVAAIAERYAEETRHEARVFAGSSPGAEAYGTRSLGPVTDGGRALRGPSPPTPLP